MPKGDRLKLKADPEDGTTPIANLLLEAVAMAKISGLQKGAIVYLWRKTYGWVGNDGRRLKEAKIPLADWMKALDRGKSRIAAALSELEEKHIIFRRMADQWGGYYYSFNTNIAKWNSNTINLARLSEMVTVATFGTVAENGTVTKTDNSPENDHSSQKHNGTVAENGTVQLPKTGLPTLYKEILNKDLNKKADVKITSPTGEKTKEVFARLDKLRGYKPSRRNAEAAAIIRMLKGARGNEQYTPEQIINTWQEMKQDKFYQGKELFMMSVESQIGAKLTRGENNGINKGHPATNQPSTDKYQESIDKYAKDRVVSDMP